MNEAHKGDYEANMFQRRCSQLRGIQLERWNEKQRFVILMTKTLDYRQGRHIIQK